MNVAERSAIPDLRDIPLRQYEDMLKATPFLFRVHDELSHVEYLPGEGFISREYVGESLKLSRLNAELPLNFNVYEVQDSVKSHIRNFFKANPPAPHRRCPWISTSPLWTWAIGEAIRRRHSCEVEVEDVKVSIIDLRKLLDFGDRSLFGVGANRRMVFHGMELLQRTRQMDGPFAAEWTNHPQEILVYGMIPASTIINTIPFESLGVPPPETQLPSSPLPPWFFLDFANRNGIAWEPRRDAKWYSGLEGVRAVLLQNFKRWAELFEQKYGGDISELEDRIVSIAFYLAEFLVIAKGEFENAIETARTEADCWVIDAEDDALAEHLQRTKLRNKFRPLSKLSASNTTARTEDVVNDEFPREKILEFVNTLWDRLIRMTGVITVWGMKDMNDSLWERLQTQIVFSAQNYARKIEELELHVKKCEVEFYHHRSQAKKFSAKMSTQRPEFVLW